jgi:DNA-binding NarL/FixJ family response regulator
VSPFRIVVLSDHQALADALIARLSREPDGFLVDHWRSGDVLPRSPRPAVVVVDAHSIPGHWSVVTDPLLEALPEAGTVILSDTVEHEDAVLAARRCLSAWLPADASAEQLIEVLRAVAAGHTVYPPVVLGTIFRWFVDQLPGRPAHGDGPLAALTDRERDVLACLIEGWRATDIARRLDMAPNTARTHTTRILRKLGAHSRLEAVRIARRHGFESWSSRHASRPAEADDSVQPSVAGRMHIVAPGEGRSSGPPERSLNPSTTPDALG